MQKFHQAGRLPAAANAVLAAITTEAYLRYRYADASLHELNIDIRQDDAQRFACCVTRRGSTEKLPAVARKIAGDALTMTQTQHWDRGAAPYKGALNMVLDGMPGHINSNLTLSDNGDGSCTLSVEGEIEARIPLFGGQIEKMLQSRVEEAFSKSTQAIRKYVEANC